MATHLHLAALPAAPPVRALPASIHSEWATAVLRDLSQVEDLLDSLENHRVEDREVTMLGDRTFVVRWR
jgi:hypothetical protein